MYMVYIVGIIFMAVFCVAEYFKATQHFMEEKEEQEYIELWKENQRLMKEVLNRNEL